MQEIILIFLKKTLDLELALKITLASNNKLWSLKC